MSGENKERVYEKEVNAALNTLHEMEEKVDDLKVSYGYSELKASFTPYEMQEQIEIMDKMILRKALQNGWTGHMMNYGTFMTVMKNFDTFEKKGNLLKEQAMRIVIVERAIRDVNDYLKGNRELLPKANFIRESPELFSLAHEYLRKIPLFDTFDKQDYRTAIIKQAMLDLKTEDMEKAVTRNVIKAKDLKGLTPVVSSVSKEEMERYKANFEYLSSALLKTKDAATEKDYINTRVVGVTFSNADGTKRQDVIKEMLEAVGKNPTPADPIPVQLIRGEYKGKPSVSVEWAKEGKQIGFVPQDVANTLFDSYPESPLNGMITEITGGFEQRTRDGKVENASLGCSLHIEIGLSKEEKVFENTKEQKTEKADKDDKEATEADKQEPLR